MDIQISHLFENPMGLDGFGEVSFKALFESIEREQLVRGVISNEK